MPKLTKRIIEGAENRDKPYFLFDKHLPGFCARIAPNGRRHYYAQYLRGKKTKRMPLGQHGIITTEQARDKAIAVMASVNDGNDPQAEKSKKRKESTVSDLAQRYMKEHVHVHCKPSTAKGYQYNLEKRIFPQLGDLRVSEVTRKDIANFHHTFRDVPYEANRCLEMLSKMFNLAEMWGLRPDGTNPRRHIKKYPEKKRERYLSEEEMRRLGNVLDVCEQDGSEYSDDELLSKLQELHQRKGWLSGILIDEADEIRSRSILSVSVDNPPNSSSCGRNNAFEQWK